MPKTGLEDWYGHIEKLRLIRWISQFFGVISGNYQVSKRRMLM